MRQREPKRIQVLGRDKDDELDARAVQQAFDELAEGATEYLANPLSNAVLIADVAVTKGEHTDVKHGLGREPKGWFQVSAQGLVQVLEVERSNKRTHLRIAGSFHHPFTEAKVSLVVF